jgi:hypothetical protein
MSSLNRFTFNHIKTILYHAALGQSVKVPLGRWGLKENKKSVDLHVMYSNEDHCGVCNEYITDIKNENNFKQQDKIYSDEYIWMLSTTADSNKK